MRETAVMGKSKDRAAKKPSEDIKVGSFGGERYGGGGQRGPAIESCTA
jgi:hypothetical protein